MYGMPISKYNIVYDTKSLLKITSGPEHSLMIHAPSSDLFIFIFSAVQTSKTPFQIAD